MPTPFDNLKPGDYIAITGCKEDPGVDWLGRERPKPHCDGLPMQVLAASFPFLAVSFGGQTGSVDIRLFEVQKVNRAYAESFQGTRRGKPFKQKRKRFKPDPRLCIRCGTRLVQKLTRDRTEWRQVCPDCGYDAGGVPVQ